MFYTEQVRPYLYLVRCIGRLEMMHKSTQITPRRFEYKMGVICHQGVQIQSYIVTTNAVGKFIQESLSIRFRLEGRLAGVTPYGDVVNGSFILYTQWSGHDKSITAR